MVERLARLVPGQSPTLFWNPDVAFEPMTGFAYSPPSYIARSHATACDTDIQASSKPQLLAKQVAPLARRLAADPTKPTIIAATRGLLSALQQSRDGVNNR